MSRTHVMLLRLAGAILLIAASFMMSTGSVALPYVHYFFLLLGALFLSPKPSNDRRPMPKWQAILVITYVLTWSLMEQEFLARTGAELIDTLWWKIPVHLWFLGIILSDAAKAFRLVKTSETETETA
jgi:membrane-bound ClpP family serine protease